HYSRRTRLEALLSPRQHAHAVAGAAHQHGFELVMTEHVAFDQRTFGEDWQLAMRYERRNAHDRIVAPVRAAVALPPGAADGVGAHAQPHAELENTGKRARRRHADHQALQNPETRIDLHDAHELEDEIDAHGAV